MYQLKTKQNSEILPRIQPKLKIGKPGDKYEQEADRVADRVMRMSGNATLQRQPVEEEEEVQAKLQMQPMEEEEEMLQPKIQMQPMEEEEEMLQAKENLDGDLASSQVDDNIRSLNVNGSLLPSSTNQLMSSAFGADFSGVQIHTDAKAARMNNELGARAFTHGNNIYFNTDEFNPESDRGQRLLAHELTHVVQQNSGSGKRIQRDDLEIRSPAFEEAVTQVSSIEASVRGRNLYPDEIRLARSVFGESIDYAQVNLIPTSLLQWRTVGNTIRVPNHFNIDDSYMSETFIHEMTHIWQYQHFGTSYISTSLSDQLVGYIQTGSRNAAYDYEIQPGMSFFEYRVEQQAMIVQTYFNLLREQANTEITAERRTEVEAQIAQHQPLIDQMRGAIPRTEAETLIYRASEVMFTSGAGTNDPFLLNQDLVPEERRMAPITPLLQIRYNLGPL